VLNMNNMRDYETDKKAGKRTIVVAMGKTNAAYYHLFLVIVASLMTIIYTLLNYVSPCQWLFLLSFPFLFLNLKKVFTYKESIELFPELGRLSMATFIFSLTFGIGLIL